MRAYTSAVNAAPKNTKNIGNLTTWDTVESKQYANITNLRKHALTGYPAGTYQVESYFNWDEHFNTKPCATDYVTIKATA